MQYDLKTETVSSIRRRLHFTLGAKTVKADDLLQVYSGVFACPASAPARCRASPREALWAAGQGRCRQQPR